MTALPPLAPLPPPEVQRSIPSEEWELYLDAWIVLLTARLETSGPIFKDFAPKDESAVLFLASFYHQLASLRGDALHAGTKARTLRKLCFLLTRRTILEATPPPSALLEWRYLSDVSCCYPSSAALQKLLSDTWNKHEGVMTSSLEKGKATIISQLSSKDSSSISKAITDIRLLTILTSSLPACGHVLMAGSDFLDTLAESYQMQKLEDIRKTLVAIVYVGLTSLLKGTKPNLSLLLDQLFSLKASTLEVKNGPTLLSDIICSSDLLNRLERYLAVQPQKRGQDLVSSLRTYQNETRAFHHRYQKPKKRVDKGKGRASELPASEEVHAHRMSLISQIQDLFPDLGSGYILRLLDHYGDDPETIIAHLLDASIPPELQELDQSEQLPPISTTQQDPLPPKPTPSLALTSTPESRKNIFDDDVDLAELARSHEPSAKNALRFGRANPTQTADDILADRTNHTANKAAILSALATFDSDDDERDDTYDVADVGGTVDANDDTADIDAKSKAEELDLTLLRAYKSNPSLFGRDSATRRSQPRDVLKRESGLTDEALEGWAVMINRDPARLAKLESKLALSAGGNFVSGAGLTQPEIKSTSYRKPKGDGGSDGETEGESSSASAPRGRGGGQGRGRGRGRGRGVGRGGGGGGGAASGDQANSAVSHQRKEQNKASRANHNRRQQRAKKVARAGGLVG